MALPLPPPAPQRGDRATFSSRVDAFLLWLVGIIPALNTFISSLTTMAAGGANTFAYTFDSATGDADPGAGRLRLGSATQNAAVVLRIDNVAGNGGDVTGFLAALAAGTSNVKASLRLQKVNDSGAYLLFDVTSVTVVAGYQNLTLTPRASSSANPFANNDTVIVYFTKQGDKGDGGGTPTAQQIRDAVGTLGIANGGTGATTAAQALAALGALPTAGGTMSGGLTFNNYVSMFLKDVGGTARQFLYMDDGGSVNLLNAGGNLFRILKQSGLGDLWVINNSGLATLSGIQIIKSTGANGTSRNMLQLQNSAGMARMSLAIESDDRPMIWTFNGTGGYTGSVAFENGGVAAGGAVSGSSLSATSDERLKENWRALPDTFLEDFAAIERAGLFDWSEDGRTDGGLGAQSIQRIAPWAVRDVAGVLHVNYGALAAAVSHALTRRVLRNESAA